MSGLDTYKASLLKATKYFLVPRGPNASALAAALHPCPGEKEQSGGCGGTSKALVTSKRS